MQPTIHHTSAPISHNDLRTRSVPLNTAGMAAIYAAVGGLLGAAINPRGFKLNSSSALIGAAGIGLVGGALGAMKAKKQNRWADSVKDYLSLEQSGLLRPSDVSYENTRYLAHKDPEAAAIRQGAISAILWGTLAMIDEPMLGRLRNDTGSRIAGAAVDAVVFGGIDAMLARDRAVEHNHRGDVVRYFLEKGKANASTQPGQTHVGRLQATITPTPIGRG